MAFGETALAIVSSFSEEDESDVDTILYSMGKEYATIKYKPSMQSEVEFGRLKLKKGETIPLHPARKMSQWAFKEGYKEIMKIMRKNKVSKKKIEDSYLSEKLIFLMKESLQKEQNFLFLKK